MSERAIKLKPGILVALSTQIRGGASYQRVDLETGLKVETGAQVDKWETTKTVADPEEYTRATKVRATISAIIRRTCIEVGPNVVICPEANEGELNAAITRSRVLRDEFNASSTYAQISVRVWKGRIASTDEEAMQAVGEEVRELLSAMSTGIDKLDAEAIREAADQARKLGMVLDESQAATVNEAVKQARAAARTIVRRIEKEGEQAAIVARDIQRGAIEKARIAFLDLDPIEIPANGASMPAVDLSRIAELDIPEEVH